MDVVLECPLTEQILASYATVIGKDLPGYRNHIYRVLSFYTALNPQDRPLSCAVQIAAAFHDLGIWTHGTLDYLAPSIQLARAFLDERGESQLDEQVSALIKQHHKLRPYRQAHAASVEAFRQADTIDVSLGLLSFGLPRPFIRKVQARYPDLGFHWMLARASARQLLRTPLRPLPMFRW